jgi:hypothetical protein
MKGLIKPLLILAILAGALYVLNPTKDDFVKYYQNKTEAASSGKASGALGGVVSGVARLAGGATGAMFARDDKLFFSVYTLGPASNPSNQYLGVAKFFIKTK